MPLLDQLSDLVVSQMSQQAEQNTGISAGAAEKLLPMAMATIMGGLKKNASNAAGAEALSNALDKHDGGLLDDLARLGDGDVQADGKKILAHILGAKQSQTEQALARTAGVNQDQIGQLLAMAAPMVLASLGKAKRDNGLDASALSGLVTAESARVQQAAPAEIGGLMSFLDQDGDGDFKDDVLEAAGKKLLGGLFGKR